MVVLSSEIGREFAQAKSLVLPEKVGVDHQERASMRIAATAFVITLLGAPPPPGARLYHQVPKQVPMIGSVAPSATVTFAESRTGSAKQPLRSSHHFATPS